MRTRRSIGHFAALFAASVLASAVCSALAADNDEPASGEMDPCDEVFATCVANCLDYFPDNEWGFAACVDRDCHPLADACDEGYPERVQQGVGPVIGGESGGVADPGSQRGGNFHRLPDIEVAPGAARQ
jgi:hypothetical protein